MPTKRLHTKLSWEYLELLRLVERGLKKFERIRGRWATKEESNAIIDAARKEVRRKRSKN